MPYAYRQMDRSIRIMGGCLLIALTAFGRSAVTFPVQIVLFSIGAYSLITGIINFCPLFHFILQEKRTRRKKNAADKVLGVQDVTDLSFFHGFSEAEIKRILSLTILREYDRDAPAVEEGKPARALRIVYSGQFKVEKRINSAETKVVDTLTDGDTFGEQSLFSNETPSVSVICMHASKVLEIGELEFSELVRQDAALGIKLLSRLMSESGARMRSLHEQIASLGYLLLQSRQQHTDHSR